MKKSALIIRTGTVLVFLAFLLGGNVASGRCESEPDLTKAQPQARYGEKRAEEKADPDCQSDKSERFRVLEWVIKQSLLNQYQRLEEQDLTITME